MTNIRPTPRSKTIVQHKLVPYSGVPLDIILDYWGDRGWTFAGQVTIPGRPPSLVFTRPVMVPA